MALRPYIKNLLADERGYIDPGTGSMLFTILIGVISAGVYGLRNAVVKAKFALSGGRAEAADEERKRVVIFTDSKRYWNLFEPICDEFERRGLTIVYYTASPDDPALEKEYKHVTCEFIGEGNRAYARMNMLKADIVLSTTPGLDVYQWKRSRDVKWYVHICHSLDDVSKYRMFGLDYYDAVLLAGEFQRHEIRDLEKLRNLPEKELLPAGLPYMDTMLARLKAAPPLPEHDTTILLAPSWGASSIFNVYGGRVIQAALDTGYHVIVRPHPQTAAYEKEMLDKLMADYPESDQLEWNFDNDNFEVLRRSDIMISDFSAVVYDFALVFDRPIIYTEPVFDPAPYDACWLDEEPWMFTTLPTVGQELTMDNLDGLKDLVDECLVDPRFKQGREEAIRNSWSCVGESAAVTTDYLVNKLAQLDSVEGADDPRANEQAGEE